MSPAASSPSALTPNLLSDLQHSPHRGGGVPTPCVIRGVMAGAHRPLWGSPAAPQMATTGANNTTSPQDLTQAIQPGFPHGVLP